MSMGFDEFIWMFILFGIPIGSVIWFIVSMILFLTTKKGNSRRKGRMIRFIVSGAIMLTLLTVVALFWFALLTAVNNM